MRGKGYHEGTAANGIHKRFLSQGRGRKRSALRHTETRVEGPREKMPGGKLRREKGGGGGGGVILQGGIVSIHQTGTINRRRQ